MLAIAQSGNNYHYLNWVPSESGPMVTHHGKVRKELEGWENIEQHLYELLDEIFSTLNNGEPICSFSLDSRYFLFYTSYLDEHNPDLNHWYQSQIKDEELYATMDYYHYPMTSESGQLFSIGIPKIIRQSFQYNMRTLKAKLNGISAGIFSAEAGARRWFHADNLESYIIWKMGKKKKDELLYIKNKELSAYFSITRLGDKIKINWQFGNKDEAEIICKYIKNLINKESQSELVADKIFMYTSNGKIQNIKFFHQLGIDNMILLNPLSVLKSSLEEKISIFDTLPLAETGNAFVGIDV